MPKRLFDDWPEQYEQWFDTRVGSLVKKHEQKLILDLLQPRPNEIILDAGCGTGVFTRSVIDHGSTVVGVDVSESMLLQARRTLPTWGFVPLVADILALPFTDGRFDKTLSVTALEFIEEARTAVDEMFRVTRTGGHVLVGTLNSRSPWADRRVSELRTKAESVFRHARFRSPAQLKALVAFTGVVKTAIHFAKDTDPSLAAAIESEGQKAGLDTGAFVIGCWRKP